MCVIIRGQGGLIIFIATQLFSIVPNVEKLTAFCLPFLTSLLLKNSNLFVLHTTTIQVKLIYTH